MLTYLLIGLAVVIALILILAAFKPDTVHYARSAVINAPPERILAQVVDFRKWTHWSPWEQLDPDMKREHSGAASGIGAKYHWSGNKKAGEGRMEIIGVAPDSVTIDLHFIKPWEAKCTTLFKTTPEAQGTRLNWVMDGPNTYMGKVFSLFVNMDKMIGRDFEKGLAALKAEAERN